MSKSSPVQDKQIVDVDNCHAGERLDRVLADYFPDLSRSRLQAWIKNQQIIVNDEVIVKPKHKMLGGEVLQITTTMEDQGEWQAVNIDLNIHYEDESLLIINKAAGLVVHPAPGHYADTLVNGLLYQFPGLRKLPRAGIVHRLDRDTTGLLVVAKTPESHNHLVSQLQQRAFHREYAALLHGQLIAGDTIDLPIGRHPVNRKKMAVVDPRTSRQAKEAITHYRIAEKFNDFTLVNVKLETGRTHQIRVHFSHNKFPLVGDPLYCLRNLKPKGISETLASALKLFNRQALHARRLGLLHPVTNELISWQVDLPQDLQLLLETIREEQTDKGND